MKKYLIVAITALLSTAALAAESQKVTLDVAGAYWPGCAGKLTAALGEGGLKPGKISANMGAGPVRTVAEGDKDLDLGQVADKVNKAETPHRGKGHLPGLSIVLFAKLDQDSAKKAADAVGKVKGVDPKETKANAAKGEISVKIKGDAKVTTDDLVKAMKGAGIDAKLTKDETKAWHIWSRSEKQTVTPIYGQWTWNPAFEKAGFLFWG